ncbi:sugar-binding transcriptional regulator [Bacillaceae bacterium Marseille-Q3522]|nr:sugar-binding transcriptional regulator [Bacillaceae bacterium Marseille-Q3522]
MEKENRELYVKIAHWYYTLGLTQDEIARRLSFTRQRVNRIISNLADKGVVTIKVNGYTEGNTKYECALEEHFGLKRVIIANTFGQSDKYLPTIANVASQFLEDYLQPNMIIGVSWGETLARTISDLSFKKRENCKVIQMLGAQNFDVEMLKADEIARSLADKLDCVSYMLYAPCVVDSPETKNWLMNERPIQKTYELINRCDVAICGIGQVTKDSTIYKRGLLKEDDIVRLREEGFIGDICINPVTISGEWKNCYISNRVISVTMDILKKIPDVVAIAGGSEKTDAIIGCLNSGVIDTLIIDDMTAEQIVKKIGIQFA